MAYVSAAYSRNWSYERGGSDFAAKLGNLLSGGADLQVSCAAHNSLLQHPQPKQHQKPHSGSGNVNDNPYKVSGPAEPWVGPHPGFAWVDQHGRPLAVGPPTRDAALLSATGASSNSSAQTGGSGSSSSAVSSNTHSTQGSSHRASRYAGMTASQRSMALWEKVSPGMMPDTTATPAATTDEAYRYEAGLLEPVDFTFHLKRTDFAEYTECKLRHMHHLKAAARN